MTFRILWVIFGLYNTKQKKGGDKKKKKEKPTLSHRFPNCCKPKPIFFNKFKLTYDNLVRSYVFMTSWFQLFYFDFFFLSAAKWV